MSFSKAQDLLRLAQMAASRRAGVSLEDICVEFGVSHRTAQRMTEALDAAFANVTTRTPRTAVGTGGWTRPRLNGSSRDRKPPSKRLEIAVRAARDRRDCGMHAR